MYVISYDISSNRLRNKAAKILEAYGTRVQYSVFECELSEKQYRDIYISLFELLKEEEDAGVLIYPFCKGCKKKRIKIGIGKLAIYLDEECIVI